MCFRFIGEESAAAGLQYELMDAPTWIIDPIDGTTNFVHRCVFLCQTWFYKSWILSKLNEQSLKHTWNFGETLVNMQGEKDNRRKNWPVDDKEG